MKNKIHSILLSMVASLMVIFVSHAAHAQNTTSFSKIVFFGDSLTDNGNLYYYFLGVMPKSPPYYEGRFANGPVWSDFIDQHYNHLKSTNYAVGGQTAIYHNPIDGYLPYPLYFSLDSYLTRTFNTDRSDTLFFIWEGANDYLNGVKNLDETTTDVIASIKYTLENLIYYGGKNFIVINLPDLSIIPFGKNNPNKSMLYAATIMHNLKLDAAIAELQSGYKNININLYNMHDLFNDFITHLDAYNKKYQTHLSNTTGSCWTGGYTLTPNNTSETMIAQQIENNFYTQSKMLGNHHKLNADDISHTILASATLLETYKVGTLATAGAKPCTNPDNYMFWDLVHPTTVAHKVLSLNMIDFINQHYKPAH